jgi:hypothetical protein
MNIQKLKQNISDFRVKMILADYIAILGNSESKENDIIAFIADENLFEKILNEEDYELKANNIYELITMKKIKVYADPRKDKIFNILDSNIIVNREIPIQYLDIIKELIYTKIVLQKLKNDSLLNKEAKKIIHNQEAIVFLRLYFYLTESAEIAELPKIKEIKDSNIVIDTVYKILIKAYDILRELNIDQPKDLLSIVLRLKELLMSPEQVNININPRILGLLKIPTQLKKLKEEKKILEYDIESIEQQIERKRVMETIPGELEKDPEVKELLKELKDKKERLKEIENKIKELREEWERLRSNKEN